MDGAPVALEWRSGSCRVGRPYSSSWSCDGCFGLACAVEWKLMILVLNVIVFSSYFKRGDYVGCWTSWDGGSFGSS